ncbi:MAG: NAD(P)-dependent oxidoreductase, partial [Chloroflexia bacterium]|nr:NAD(P)-dependent oxidoreductase [Chloroflexia bacterium]
MTGATQPRILITGGCGRIGLLLARHLVAASNKATPPRLTLLDRRTPPTNLGLAFAKADIAHYDAIRTHFEGQEIIVHLAADSRNTATWDTLLPNNVIGTSHVLQAAQEASCRRVILASSLHAVLGYEPEIVVHADMPPRPANLYGITKVWAETLGYRYAQQGLSVLCVRIGWLKESSKLAPDDANLDLIITPRDLTHLLTCCITAPDSLCYGIFHGLSANRVRRFDISEAQSLLGYQPQDDAFALAQRNYRILLRRWAGRIKRRMFKRHMR